MATTNTGMTEKQLEEHLKKTLGLTKLITQQYTLQSEEVKELMSLTGKSAKEALKTIHALQGQLRTARDIDDVYGSTVGRIANCHKQMMRYGDAIKTAGVNVSAMGDEEKEIFKARMEGYGKSLDEITKQNSLNSAAVEQLRYVNDEILKMAEGYSTYGKKRKEIDGKILDAQNSLLDLQAQASANGKKLTDEEMAQSVNVIKSLEKQKEVLSEISKEIEDAKDGLSGYGKNAEGLAKLKVAKNAMGGLTNVGDPAAMAGTAQKLAGLGELLGDGFLKTIVEGAGLFAKALSGPLGMVIFGAIEVGKKMIELDNMRKGWNKDYSTMAGQQFSGGDFSKQASQFNSTIFDVKRNMDLGTDFKDWQDMFKAFHSAGVTVDELSNKTGSLGKVEQTVFTTSKELGTDLNQTAQLMGDTMLETRSSLDKVRDSYNYIANAAKKSGIESTRFMQVVNQSVLALGTYGNFLKVAAKNLQSFSASGVTSQKDAEAAATAMTDLLSKGGIENIPILEMAKQGGFDVRPNG